MAKGPRVNIYESQVAAQGNPGSPNISPEMTGGGLARAVASFGSDIGVAAQEYNRQKEKERLILEKDDEDRAKAGAAVAISQMGTYLDEREQGIRDEVGDGDPTGYAGRVNGEVQKASDGLLDKVTHPKAKLYAQMHLANIAESRFKGAMTYERNARDDFGSNNVVNATAAYAKELARDPSSYEVTKKAMLEMVDLSLSSPTKREKHRDLVEKSLRLATGYGRMANDPAAVFAATGDALGIAPAVDPAKVKAEPERVETALKTSDTTALFEAVIHQESRGKHTDSTGALTRSSKGALGISQVMPATGFTPGFGVAPLKDQTEAEYRRFGQDYLNAMVREFKGDNAKALAAYNGGHATVKAAVVRAQKEFGDADRWLEKMPAETQAYVEMITSRVGYPPPPEPVRVASADTGTAIDTDRPMLANADGTYSTERTITVESDGRHFLVPTIVNGKQYPAEEAVTLWQDGKNAAVGEYASAEEADAAAVARSKKIGQVRDAEFYRADDAPDAGALVKGRSKEAWVNDLTPDELVKFRHEAKAAMERDLSVGKAEMDRHVADAVAMAADGKRPPQPMMAGDFVRLYGPVEGTRRNFEYQQLLVVADDVKGFSTMTNGEIQTLLKYRESDPGAEGSYAASEQRNALRQRAAAEVDKQRKADPAGYVMKHSPSIKAAADRIFGGASPLWLDQNPANAAERDAAMADYLTRSHAEQQRLGIEKPMLVPDAVESYIVRGAQMAGGSGDRMAAHIEGLSQVFGDRWPDVYKQVVGGKSGANVPDSFIIIPLISTKAGKEEAARLDGAKVEDMKHAVGEARSKEVADAVQAELASYLQTMMPGARNTQTAKALLTLGEKIGLSRVQGGATPADAARMAAKVLVGHLAFTRDGSTRSYGVPTKEGPQEIANGVAAATQAIQGWNLPSPPDQSGSLTKEEASKVWGERVSQRPLWVTKGDESGLVLYTVGDNGEHKPVTWQDGTQVSFDWNALRQWGKDAPSRAVTRTSAGESVPAAFSFARTPEQERAYQATRERGGKR